MERSDETPRDLLLGLLALQVGMIDQDQLVDAFSMWTRKRGDTLDEILVGRGAIAEDGRDLLAEMAEILSRKHGGDAERSLASIAVGPSTRRKPQEMGDTDLTASVAYIRDQTPTPDSTATMTIGTAAGDGRRFRVLRPHGQGDLGAVFVAIDGELNREVAFKRILDRFRGRGPSTRDRSSGRGVRPAQPPFLA